MKELIKKFHLDNKELIEVTTVVFVIAGLVLNIDARNQIGKVSIGQISFFLLACAVILLIYLLFQAFIVLAGPLSNYKFQSKQIDPKKKLQEETFHSAYALFAILFILLLILLFTANILIYLISTFPNESLFLLISALSYSLCIYIGVGLPNPKKKWAWSFILFIYSFVTIVLLLIVPIYFYIKTIWLAI